MKYTWILLNTLWLFCLSFAAQAWTVRYQHTDLQGSVIAESNAQGSIQQRYDYKPYGEGTPSQKSGLGYTGHLEDQDLGLTYMQQRFYDPVIGRFYSNDPVGYLRRNPSMSFNRFLYVNNNPLKYTDPSGMVMSCEVVQGTLTCNSTQSRPHKTPQNYIDGQLAKMILQREVDSSIQNSMPNTNKVCIGVGRVLAGNPATIGRAGGFSGDSIGTIPVTANSAAIDPSQWAHSKSSLRPVLSQISGSTYGGQSFNSVSDVIGSSEVANVRDSLKAKNSGALLLELVSGQDEGLSVVSLNVPASIECPSGTSK